MRRPYPLPISRILAAAVIVTLACSPAPELAENLMKLSKRLVWETSLHTIREIHYGDCHPSPGREIIIVGYDGALLSSRDDRELASVEFATGLARPEVVDMTGDGRCEFLDRGMGWHSSGLLDHAGEVAWSLADESGIEDIAAGDLDDDGLLDLVFAMNRDDGLRRYDHTGRLVWQVPVTVSNRVAIVDVDGDGRKEIVHNDNSDHIRVRDEHGNLVWETRVRRLPTVDFSIVEVGAPLLRPHLFFGFFSKESWITDFDGTPKRRFAGPLGIDVRPAMVRFTPGAPISVALLFSEMHMRSPAVLQVYDEDDDVVFRAEHERACWAIATVPRAQGPGERLLVGCGHQVWEYSLEGS